MYRVLALTVVLALPLGASGAALGPKKPSDLVTLKESGAICGFAGLGGVVVDTRMNPDGTTTAGFTIPPGSVLVLDGIMTFSGVIGVAGGSEFLWNVVSTDASTELLPGIVIGPGQSVCVNAPPGSPIRLHGYLTKK